MKKTFLLGTRPWLFLFLTLLFWSNAVMSYFDPEQSRLDYVLMMTNALVGLYTLLYAFFVLTDLAGTAPKVVVSNEGLFLRAKPFSSGQDVKWEEIQAITFHSYQIDLKLETKPVFFSYKATSKTSREIKEAIRDMADLKGITVSGG